MIINRPSYFLKAIHPHPYINNDHPLRLGKESTLLTTGGRIASPAGNHMSDHLFGHQHQAPAEDLTKYNLQYYVTLVLFPTS